MKIRGELRIEPSCGFKITLEAIKKSAKETKEGQSVSKKGEKTRK